jgi:hypothetical protein
MLRSLQLSTDILRPLDAWSRGRHVKVGLNQHPPPSQSRLRTETRLLRHHQCPPLYSPVHFSFAALGHGPVLDMTHLKEKPPHTLPQLTPRSIDPVNYARAFMKSKMGYENMFPPSIDKESVVPTTFNAKQSQSDCCAALPTSRRPSGSNNA